MRRYLLTGVLIVLLAAAGFTLPSVLMKWQDEGRIEKKETEMVEKVILTGQTNLTLTEKLQLMKRDTVTTMTLINGKNHTQDTYAAQADAELQKLVDLGVLNLNGQTLQDTDAVVQFFVDTVDGTQSLMIWDIIGNTKDYDLGFSMDDETGKILSVWQRRREYYDAAGDNTAGDTAADTVTEAEKMNTEELEKLAEKWGDYLGCTQSDISKNTKGWGFSVDDQEMLEMEVKTLVKTGLTEEEACQKVYEEWGLENVYNKMHRFVAVYHDEQGTAAYQLQKTSEILSISVN